MTPAEVRAIIEAQLDPIRDVLDEVHALLTDLTKRLYAPAPKPKPEPSATGDLPPRVVYRGDRRCQKCGGEELVSRPSEGGGPTFRALRHEPTCEDDPRQRLKREREELRRRAEVRKAERVRPPKPPKKEAFAAARRRAQARGRADAAAGKPRDACPWPGEGGGYRAAWLWGYDHAAVPAEQA